MKHIKQFENYRIERRRVEIIKEAVLQVNDIYKVKNMVDIPQSLINSYVKKVKDNTGKNLRQFFSDMDIAEEILKYVTLSGLDGDKIPATALVGGAQGDAQGQGQIQGQGQMQTQPQGQAQMQGQGQMQPQGQAQTQGQGQVQVQTEAQPQSSEEGFEDVQGQPQGQDQGQIQTQGQPQGQSQDDEDDEDEFQNDEEELPI